MATDRNELLLKWHRDQGFTLVEMQDQLLLFTSRTRAHGRFVGSFPRIKLPPKPELAGGEEWGWPLRLIWTVCDFELGASATDYEKVDISDPVVRDKLEHGVFTPEREQLLPISKGRLSA